MLFYLDINSPFFLFSKKSLDFQFFSWGKQVWGFLWWRKQKPDVFWSVCNSHLCHLFLKFHLKPYFPDLKPGNNFKNLEAHYLFLNLMKITYFWELVYKKLYSTLGHRQYPCQCKIRRLYFIWWCQVWHTSFPFKHLMIVITYFFKKNLLGKRDWKHSLINLWCIPTCFFKQKGIVIKTAIVRSLCI